MQLVGVCFFVGSLCLPPVVCGFCMFLWLVTSRIRKDKIATVTEMTTCYNLFYSRKKLRLDSL